MNKIVVPTGYMGSGSSAITDLIAEVDGYDADTGTFEYVFLHCPNGVFDLEDKLLIGNNALRSDEALHAFRKTMKQLFDKKYWWVGHYNKNVSPHFMEITNQYIESLVQHRPEFYWYYQENADWKMLLKLVVRKIVQVCTFGNGKVAKPLLYNDLILSYVKPEEFYTKTRRFLQELWEEMGIKKRNLILDQLLLPFNLFRLPNYFDQEEIRVFVVERDPRDVFIINKYIWSKNNEPVPYPTDVHDFCKFYRKLREMEILVENGSVFRLHFEELIYNYEETVARVLETLGEKSSKHTKKNTKFIPARSIENTQLFLINEKYAKEANIIRQELSEYLYDFPYERVPNCNKTF